MQILDLVADREISVWVKKKAATIIMYSNWKLIDYIPNLVFDGAKT
jgi:hypothetical protein